MPSGAHVCRWAWLYIRAALELWHQRIEINEINWISIENFLAIIVGWCDSTVRTFCIKAARQDPHLWLVWLHSKNLLHPKGSICGGFCGVLRVRGENVGKMRYLSICPSLWYKKYIVYTYVCRYTYIYIYVYFTPSYTLVLHTPCGMVLGFLLGFLPQFFP